MAMLLMANVSVGLTVKIKATIARRRVMTSEHALTDSVSAIMRQASTLLATGETAALMKLVQVI